MRVCWPSLQVSKHLAMEFAIAKLLCKSECFEIATLNPDSSNVKVNQSEVALLNASLKRCQTDGDGSVRFSSIRVSSEVVSNSIE